jgi:carbonic anhydrase
VLVRYNRPTPKPEPWLGDGRGLLGPHREEHHGSADTSRVSEADGRHGRRDRRVLAPGTSVDPGGDGGVEPRPGIADRTQPLGRHRVSDLRPGHAAVSRQHATDRVAPYRGAPLLLRYQSSELGIENTGHVVEVPIPAGVHDTLQVSGDRYELVQYHFHAPSEHAVDGRLADVEAHFVHTNAQGATVVVGVFFRRGPESNALLDRILLSAPATAGEEVLAGEASPAELFHHLRGVRARRAGRVQVNSFYAYDGSLTTPGCTEDVRWFLVADGGHISGAAVTRFHRVIARFPDYDGYPNNNRPLQPLNGRVISLRRGQALERPAEGEILHPAA